MFSIKQRYGNINHQKSKNNHNGVTLVGKIRYFGRVTFVRLCNLCEKLHYVHRPKPSNNPQVSFFFATPPGLLPSFP